MTQPTDEPTTMHDRLREAARLASTTPVFDRDAPPFTYETLKAENLLESIALSLVVIAAEAATHTSVDLGPTSGPPVPWQILERISTVLADVGYTVPTGQPLTAGHLDFIIGLAQPGFAGNYRVTVTRMPDTD